MTLSPKSHAFKVLTTRTSVAERDPLPTLPFHTPFWTYPGNASQGWRGGELAQQRKYKLNDTKEGRTQKLGVGEQITDCIVLVRDGLKELQDKKETHRTNYSWSRRTPLPVGKWAVRQYSDCIFPHKSKRRTMEHFYKTEVPEFSLDAIPRNAPHTCVVLGDTHVPHNTHCSFIINFYEIPCNERVCVGLLQDSPTLDVQHLNSHNPFLFWTAMRQARIEGCGVDIWRLPNGQLRVTRHHVSHREEPEYLGPGVPIKDQIVGDIPPPACFSPMPGFTYDCDNRLATVKDGLDNLSTFRKKNVQLTQYTGHTRSVPAITPLPTIDKPRDPIPAFTPFAEVEQPNKPLEVKVFIEPAKEPSIQWHNVDVRYQIGDELEVTIGPVRVWDPLKGKKRYWPCIGLSKGVTAAVEDTGCAEPEPIFSPDSAEWSKCRRAFTRCHFSGVSGLINANRSF